jgi:hypothetical protein
VFDNLVRRVWVAKCDPTPENRELAEQLWVSAKLAVSTALCLLVWEDVAHPVGVVKPVLNLENLDNVSFD